MSELLWRLLVPRPVPVRTLAPFTIIVLGVALAVGFALGVAYEDVVGQVTCTVGLVAVGLAFGLGSIVVLDRLRSKFAFGSHSVQTAVSTPYLIYVISGVIGAVFTLYVRSIIPEGALEAGLATRPLVENAVVVLLTVLIWTVVGGAASMMHERTEKRKEYEAALKEKISDLEESRRRIVLAQETVRQKIASRLHGPVQTRLLILRKSLEECEGMIQSQPDRAIAVLTQVGEELDQLQTEEIRGISRELHPSIIRLGLPATLRSLCDRFATLIPITLEIGEEVDHLVDPANPLIPQDITLALYRLAEEAMNNVIKHARATGAMLRMQQPSQGQIELSVEDDGIGFRVGTQGPGLGILTMQDYIGAVGGTFHIESTLGKGTKVTAIVVIKGLGR